MSADVEVVEKVWKSENIAISVTEKAAGRPLRRDWMAGYKAYDYSRGKFIPIHFDGRRRSVVRGRNLVSYVAIRGNGTSLTHVWPLNLLVQSVFREWIEGERFLSLPPFITHRILSYLNGLSKNQALHDRQNFLIIILFFCLLPVGLHRSNNVEDRHASEEDGG